MLYENILLLHIHPIVYSVEILDWLKKSRWKLIKVGIDICILHWSQLSNRPSGDNCKTVRMELRDSIYVPYLSAIAKTINERRSYRIRKLNPFSLLPSSLPLKRDQRIKTHNHHRQFSDFTDFKLAFSVFIAGVLPPSERAK